MDSKHIQNALNNKELADFDMAMQHKSKLRIYKELKQGTLGLKSIKNVHGALARLFCNFLSGTHGLVEEVSGAMGMGHGHVLSNRARCI